MTRAADPLTIGERLTVNRRRAGWSQVRLARKLRIAQSLIAAYEKDEFDPAARVPAALAVDPEPLAAHERLFVFRRRLGLTVDAAARMIGRFREHWAGLEGGRATKEQVAEALDALKNHEEESDV